MAWGDLWTTVTGYFGGTPGDTGVAKDLFIAQAEPNWVEINRVLEAKGKTEMVERTIAQVEARNPLTPLSYTIAQTYGGAVSAIKSTVTGLPGFFQTTLTKVLIAIVALVIGLLLLNTYLSRTAR